MPDPTSDDDAALEEAIRRVQGGDAEAYAVVVRGCAPFLRSWIALRAPAGIDADEVAHQVFIAAFAKLEDYRPGTRFRAWLAAFARHVLLNEVRAARRRQAHVRGFADIAWLEAGERQLVAEEAAEAPERRLQAMRQCLARLAGPARALIALRYEEGLRVDEIARRLGRSAGAIAKHLHLLRQRLHDCISGRLGAGGGEP